MRPERGRSRPVLAGVLAGLLAVLAAPPAASWAESSPSTQWIPVLGSVTLTQDRKWDGTRATVLVHGVRRIPGASVLYFSGGLPAGADPAQWASFTRTPFDRISEAYTFIGRVRLVDFGNRQVYLPLMQKGVNGAKEALVSPPQAWPSAPAGGTFYTFYAVMPELPKDLETVDVMVGNGDMVHDVPVGDGVLEPAVVQEGPIPLGEGWPQIDQAAAAASLQPEASVLPLNVLTSDLEETVTSRGTADSTSLDLAADVLFDLDSATLGPDAGKALAKAAAQVNDAANGGGIQIVGHTDSSGSDAHNVDLSRRRAQAVAAALEPLITVPGVKYAVTGRGEAEPVESNSTAEGREKNRRVSVVFTPKSGD